MVHGYTYCIVQNKVRIDNHMFGDKSKLFCLILLADLSASNWACMSNTDENNSTNEPSNFGYTISVHNLKRKYRKQAKQNI